MAKKVVGEVKLQLSAGKANPAPPVGPALGKFGVNIMEFCKQFNAQTSSQEGSIIPVIITIMDDRSFTFVLKTPPASDLIKKAFGIDKGAKLPGKEKVGSLTQGQLKDIAQLKLPDLTACSLNAAMKTIMGTARTMGVEVIAE
jgi:large subunit ribosomal protein L11